MAIKEKSAAAKFLETVRTSTDGQGAAFKKILSAPASFSGGVDDLYTTLRKKLKMVELDGEELYVVEGDTLLDEAQLEVYAMQKEAANKVSEMDNLTDSAGLGRFLLGEEDRRGLIGITQGGRIVRWQPGMVLTYCVLKRTFSLEKNYKLVAANFVEATKAWEDTCGINFEYKPSLDDTANTDPQGVGVVFVVREFNAGGQFIASAFFPNDPTYRRRVLIDPSYYQPGGFDPVGVLRHELGHVLGFRHEHIRASAPIGCKDEGLDGTIELTAYDSKSVMHYLCGGMGDKDLKISATDKAGAQKVYGPPLSHSMYAS